ncbi:hypothetical protein ABBQ32_002393 [Trebouxia sp. C0010 RCD-2024]
MLLWAEDVDIPLDTARQAVQHVHAQHMSLVTQHGTASHVALPEPLQSLMVEAIRAVTGDASFTPLPGTDQPLSPKPPPLASESAPRRSSRARHPVTPYLPCTLQPLGGLNEPTQDPLPAASLPQWRGLAQPPPGMGPPFGLPARQPVEVWPSFSRPARCCREPHQLLKTLMAGEMSIPSLSLVKMNRLGRLDLD